MKTKLILLLLLISACTGPVPSGSTDPFASVVMITNMPGNSGGTGVVLASSPTKSLVLTNRHVCGLAKSTSMVHSSVVGDATIVSYQPYAKHDLCLITVFTDLGARAELAERAPRVGDSIMVLGHPQLLPVTRMYGAISGKMMVPVSDGMRDCKPGDDVFLCFLFGGKMPISHLFESMAVSALISPGSSGSPVFNADGKIVALIFAGLGELSYGIAVPYEYIVNFLSEVNTIEEHYPNSEVK